jgi:hypothetical protein
LERARSLGHRRATRRSPTRTRLSSGITDQNLWEFSGVTFYDVPVLFGACSRLMFVKKPRSALFSSLRPTFGT